MFKLFYEIFLNNGINARKVFQFSHDPVNDVGALVREYYYDWDNGYGYKCNMKGIDSAKKEVTCILYDSFWLICSLDDQYGRFGAGLEIGEKGVITDFLGKGVH